MKTTTEQMDASQVLCPNLACVARGHVGQGNIVSHGKARARYRCKTCGKTFSAQAGTMFEGLRKPKAVIVIVVTRLSYGCPIQAIVQAFGLDERTVASWRDRAGKHCQQVHQTVVQQGQLDLVHVQADEIRVKGCKICKRTYNGLLGPPTKCTTLRSLPIKNPVKEHLSVEKSCHVQDNLTSCPLLKCTEAALRHAFGSCVQENSYYLGQIARLSISHS